MHGRFPLLPFLKSLSLCAPDYCWTHNTCSSTAKKLVQVPCVTTGHLQSIMGELVFTWIWTAKTVVEVGKSGHNSQTKLSFKLWPIEVQEIITLHTHTHTHTHTRHTHTRHTHTHTR